jgi:hypothetical protein
MNPLEFRIVRSSKGWAGVCFSHSKHKKTNLCVFRLDTLGTSFYPQDDLTAFTPEEEEIILSGLRLMAPRVYNEAMALLRRG